ncbi:PAS domain S-box protein [Solirubrobacter ginsenosidimutans]|uniref:PAS domain S-box protein n=1 Tax=Solirubrobacter ginsenosidimutans TaxID=490573 RepID=A0A9X3MRR1_9ACTN|nr:PAS domain S-box protein [Solirubrobacter ginsenosidimutans]MDA0161349.1 PAS domain S-box protein [Solirubrobacter ginsenosidimutans]
MTILAADAQPHRSADASWWERSEDLLCVLGDDLVLRAANPAWGRVLGRPPHAFVGAHVFECVHPDDARAILDCLPVAADRFTDLQCRLRDARGRWRWVLWSGVRRGAAWDCSGKDVTALRARTGRGRNGDALARVLRDGLCEVDPYGRIVEVNERFCEMVGFSAAELEGARAPFAFWPEEDHATLAAHFALALTGDERRLELVFCRKDGERFPVTLDASHIEVGADIGAFICVVRDMSREVAERERLREAHRVARLASWELDPRTMSLELSSDLRHIGGLRLPSDPRVEHVLPLIADADRDRAVDALSEVTSGVVDEIVVETAVAFAPDDTRYLETRMQGVRGAAGAVRSVRGTTQDVTARRRAELAREESEERLRQAQRMSGMGSFEVDYSTATINWSPELYRLFGVEGEHFELGLSGVRAMLPAPDREHVVELASETAADGRPRGLEHRYLRAGEPRWAEMRLERLREGAVRGTMQDITARKEAQREIDLQAQLLDAVEVALIASDLQGCVTHWNRGAERLYGWSGAEVLGRSITEFTVVPEDDGVADEIMATVLAEQTWEGEFEVGRKDGSRFPVYMRAALFVDADGHPAGIVGVSVDLSERNETARRLRVALDYSRAITDSMGEGLFTVDGDGRLTYINSAAEALLGWCGEELVGRDMHDTIHHRRPDGTPFDSADCPLYTARREGRLVRIEDDVFIRRDGAPLPVAYTATPLDVGDGVAGSVVVFSDISHRKAEERRLREQVDRVTWAGRVHEALNDERMELHAQPIIELATGRTVQHELLIRMRDRDGALVMPDRFLPAAEAYGVIVDVDRWVVSRATELAGQGHAVELNLSARSLGAPGLVEHFQAELARTGADAGLLVVELTETALLEDEQAAEAFIERVKSFGCKLALDDFGTGYGGFVYVKRLPVDYLKIDIEFVRDLVVNQASQEVVRAIVGLARGFGQRTVAEGAEDQRTLELLRELGVDYAQGYGIARPAPVAEVFGG